MIMRSKDRLLELAALFLIVALAAYLRLANLAANPGWYTDEGTHLDIARNLSVGRVQYLAVDQSLLLFSRLPLFEALLTLWTRLFGLSMEALRMLTGTLGVINVATLYAVVRRISRDRGLALTAAFLLAIYPSAALYNRFGFSYNLLAPLMLIAVWGVCEYSALHPARRAPASRTGRERSVAKSKDAKRWLAVSALSIGLGAISDVWAWLLIVPFGLIVLIRNWRDLWWSVPLALMPLSLYALIEFSTSPQAFLFDLGFVLSRLNQLSVARQIETLWQNLTTLSAQDGWFTLGAIGLLAVRPARTRWIVLAFAIIPFVLLGRTTALFSLSYYYLIPLLPLIALGMASAIRCGVDVLDKLHQKIKLLAGNLARDDLQDNQPPHSPLARLGQSRQSTLLTVGLMGTIGLFTVPPLIAEVNTSFRTDIDPFLIDASSAQEAAAFVNERVSGDDLVIASPAIAWQIQSNVADFQMSIAHSGQATPHLPPNLPVERWAFDPSYQRARFVIVDNLWRNWAVPNVPGARAMLGEVEAWPLALKTGEIDVYANPR